MIMKTETWDPNLKDLVKKQVFFLAGISIPGYFYAGLNAVMSIWLGGTICILPLLLFGSFFLPQKNQNPRKILGVFYLAEILKIILTLVLFTLALQWSKLNAGALMLGFISAQLGILLSLNNFRST